MKLWQWIKSFFMKPIAKKPEVATKPAAMPNLKLLEEARRWVGVREKGGNNRGPEVEKFQKAVDGRASGEAWCFPGNTEILTEEGWCRFDELDPSLSVAQVDENGLISFSVPIKHIKKNYNGGGFHIATRAIDLVCDEGHRFFGRFNNSKELRFGTLDDVTTNLHIPPARSSVLANGFSKQQLEFLAAFLSDGFESKTRQGKPRIKIQVSRERKIAALERLPLIGRSTASRVYGISKTPLTTFLFDRPSWLDDVCSEYKVLRWDFIYSLSADQCRDFLESYVTFDGTKKRASHMVFSSNKKLADQLLTIAVLAGFVPSISHATSKLSGRLNYIIRWCPTKISRTIKKSHISKISLADTLYCVEVPKGRIIVRGEDSSPVVVGNCMAFVQFCIEEVENSLKVKSQIFRSEHCQTTFNKSKALRVNDPKPGDIIIWKHGNTTNGHTGFVEFVEHDKAGKVFAIHTIEGNTGDFSFRDGDGVFKRTRHPLKDGNMFVMGYLRAFPESVEETKPVPVKLA